jgi:hypothetical protein
MVEVPAPIPSTSPVIELIVATELLLVLHVPPVVALVSTVVCPLHKFNAPALAASVPLTVTVRVAKQPNELVNLIVVVPALLPVTKPVVPTDAIAGVALLQVPVPTDTSMAVDSPEHILLVPPCIGAGIGFTVTIAERKQPVGRV